MGQWERHFPQESNKEKEKIDAWRGKGAWKRKEKKKRGERSRESSVGDEGPLHQSKNQLSLSRPAWAIETGIALRTVRGIFHLEYLGLPPRPFPQKHTFHTPSPLQLKRVRQLCIIFDCELAPSVEVLENKTGLVEGLDKACLSPSNS